MKVQISQQIIERLLTATGTASVTALVTWQATNDIKAIIIATGLSFLSVMGFGEGAKRAVGSNTNGHQP